MFSLRWRWPRLHGMPEKLRKFISRARGWLLRPHGSAYPSFAALRCLRDPYILSPALPLPGQIPGHAGSIARDVSFDCR